MSISPAVKAKPVHYVDNKLLFEVLVKFLKEKAAWEKKPVGPRPETPEYVGECLLKIAQRYSTKGNFASYTFRDDMVSDAVENCLLYMHNFDPKKSKNPFAYFTQITSYAFFRRIAREKRHVYTKYKYAMRQSHNGTDYASSEDGESGDLKAPTWMSYENVHHFIRDYEAKLAETKLAKPAKLVKLRKRLETPSFDTEDIRVIDMLVAEVESEEDDDILEHDSLVDRIPTEEELDREEAEDEDSII